MRPGSQYIRCVADFVDLLVKTEADSGCYVRGTIQVCADGFLLAEVTWNEDSLDWEIDFSRFGSEES